MLPPVPVAARTLADVARAACVSRMTVSRVLRHPERVSEATRQRVLAAVEALGYRPNPLISTLMASTRQRRVSETNAGILFFVSMPRAAMLEYEVARRIAEGARVRALAKGYEVFIHSLVDEPIDPRSFARTFRSRGIEGLIFGPLDREHAELELDPSGFPCAACGFSLVRPAVHRVATNQWELASRAYLTAELRGYRRIGVVIPNGYLQGMGRYWSSAFLFHQQRTGNEVPTLLHGPQGEPELRRWLRRWKPDCVIGSASEHFDWVQAAGGHIPEGRGFLLLGSSSGRPEISGWLKNYEGIGEAAVDLIALQLHANERGLPRYRKTVLLDPQWNEGTTLRAGPQPYW